MEKVLVSGTPNFFFRYDIGKIALDWLTDKKLAFDWLTETSNTFGHVSSKKNCLLIPRGWNEIMQFSKIRRSFYKP